MNQTPIKLFVCIALKNQSKQIINKHIKKMTNLIKYLKPVVLASLLMPFLLGSCAGPEKAETPHPDQWLKNAVLYEVNVRQFTPEGTFNAFREHLPRLKEMGVDILWFMPVTPIGVIERKGTLGSYYSVKDYTAINPEFGTMEDFKSLVEEIHRLGMFVIIDWVANHTAWDHSWTLTNPEFYYRDADGNFTPPHNTDWSDVIQLDYDNPALWDAMIAEMQFWVEEVNIDGFRCDVAYLVPTPFWDRAREELDEIKPVFMLAEADHPELNEHAFQAGYSWISHHAMNRIAQGEDDVSALDNYYFDDNMGDFPEGSFKIKFIDNHDENSWAGTVFDRLGEAKETFAVLSFVLDGMPLLYNGQEAGLNHMLEFFEKDEIDWRNLRYEAFYRELISFKHNNRALWNGLAGGRMVRVHTNDDLSVFSFVREKEGNKVFSVFNLSSQPREVVFRGGQTIFGSYTVLFGGEEQIDEDFTLYLEPWGFMVYYR